jgi:hypothetical protein
MFMYKFVPTFGKVTLDDYCKFKCAHMRFILWNGTLYYVLIMEIYMVRITPISSSNATLTIPNNCASNGSVSVSGNGTTRNGGIHFSTSRWGHST